MSNFDSLQTGVMSKDHSWGSGIPHLLIVKDSREKVILSFYLKKKNIYTFFLAVGLAVCFNDCIHFECILVFAQPFNCRFFDLYS